MAHFQVGTIQVGFTADKVNRVEIARLLQGQDVVIELNGVKVVQYKSRLCIKSRNVIQFLSQWERNSVAEMLLSMSGILRPILDMPRDIQKQLFLRLPYEDIMLICRVIPKFRSLCDQSFWEKKVGEVGSMPEEFQIHLSKLPASERYLQLYSYYSNTAAPGSERYVHAETCLMRSAKAGDFQRSLHFVPIIDWDPRGCRLWLTPHPEAVCRVLAKCGDLGSLRKLETKILQQWSCTILRSAARRNQRRIIDYMLTLAKPEQIPDYHEDIVTGAIRGRQFELAREFLRTPYARAKNARHNAFYAAKVGNFEFFMYFYKSNSSPDNLLLEAAAQGGNPEILSILTKDISNSSFPAYVFRGAVLGRNIELAKEAARSDETGEYLNHVYLLYANHQKKVTPTLRKLTQEGIVPELDRYKITGMVEVAVNSNDVARLEEILDIWPQYELSPEHWELNFSRAVSDAHYLTARHIYRKYKPDMSRILNVSAREDNLYAVKFLVQLGATQEQIRVAYEFAPWKQTLRNFEGDSDDEWEEEVGNPSKTKSYLQSVYR